MSSTSDKIAVMQAFDRGEKVEFSRFEKDGEALDTSTPWTEIGHPLWNFKECNYRVKPKPREFWVNVYHPTKSLLIHATKAGADEVGSGRIERIHVREVLE